MDQEQKEQLLSYIERSHERTQRVSRCITEEFLERDGGGRFTLGDLVRHIAATKRYMFIENAAQRPSRYPGCARDLADGLPAVLEFQRRTHLESMEILRALAPEDFDLKCQTPAGAPIAVWKWLRAMTEHEAHHRGQIYLQLGIYGVATPPLFGLTSEEVKARSQP
jgi:uncharacterized damage-inducible protein DinB